MNPIPQDNLLVDLNANTMFTTGDVLAAEGQSITNWGNAITGNGINGATPPIAGTEPILRISPIDGAKEVKFDGSNDVLTFNNTNIADLHWTKNDSHCIIVFLGDIITDGRTFHRGYSNYAGEYSLFFSGGDYSNFVYSTNSPDQFWTTIARPSTKTLLAINYNGSSQAFDGWINNTKIFNNASVVGDNNSITHPTTIGARTGTSATSYGHFYGGSIRRVLVWDRNLTDTEILNIYNELS